MVLIQLVLWKSVGAFSVSLWELSQTLHLFNQSAYIWCCFIGSGRCLETQLGTVVQAWKIFTGWRPLQLCPIVMKKPEFTVSRLERRTGELLCLLMDGLEAMLACNYHPACPAFIVPEQEISPEPVICWGSRGRRVYLFHCQAVCVLEAFLLVLPGKMYTCHTAAEASHQSMLMDHKKVVLLLQCCLIGSL